MKWYCEHCKILHSDNDLCPQIRLEIKQHPEWLGEAANFAIIVGKQELIAGQSLDKLSHQVNNLIGTDLAYEGTRRYARDIQVFSRLNTEAFNKSGVFSSPEKAKAYLQGISTNEAMRSFDSKLTGYAQEVDWMRLQNGKLSSLFNRSELLNGNAPGIDGVTYNRFTGKTISRTSIKNSINPVNKSSTIITNAKKALDKGTSLESDIIFGPQGTQNAIKAAGMKNPVSEYGNFEQTRISNDRLKQKISNNQATTTPSLNQVGSKMFQGAIVGAAIELTVSGISNYVRYKKGQITKHEAITNAGQDIVKGALVGAALAGVTILLPEGVIGFVAGLAIGIYIGSACTNILDEIFGKGAYGAILNASGYVYGMTSNLEDQLQRIEENVRHTENTMADAYAVQKEVEDNFTIFDKMKGE